MITQMPPGNLPDISIDSISAIHKEICLMQPSPEEWFWAYAQAVSLDMKGALTPELKEQMPILRHMAEQYMNDRLFNSLASQPPPKAH